MFSFQLVDRETATSALGALMLVGDYGACKYLMSRAADVVATAEALRQLVVDLDVIFMKPWPPIPDATAVRWVVTNPWKEWGWASGLFADGLWLDSTLAERGVSIIDVKRVLSAEVPRLQRVDEPAA